MTAPPRGLAVLPVCYCTAHDAAHVHLPVLRDGQYGLRVYMDDPPPRCACTHEAGDSPCPVHGMDEEYPREPSPSPTASEPRVVRYGPATSRCAKSEDASAHLDDGQGWRSTPRGRP